MAVFTGPVGGRYDTAAAGSPAGPGLVVAPRPLTPTRQAGQAPATGPSLPYDATAQPIRTVRRERGADQRKTARAVGVGNSGALRTILG